MKPKPAPIHCPVPRPTRFHAAASNVRSDKSPNRMAPRKSKSNRRRCKPSDRSCKDAKSASFLLRAVAKHTRNQRSLTTRHETRASYKTLNSRKSALFREFHEFRVRGAHACAEQPVQIPTAQQQPVQLQRRFVFQRALFRVPQDRPRAEKAVVAGRPDVPPPDVPGPGAQLPRSFLLQSAVSDTKAERRSQ